MYRLAIFASHPIQYQTPLFKKMAEDGRIEPTVYFASKGASEEAYDSEFGRKIKWDIPLLEGYRHFFVRSKAKLPWILLRKKEEFDAVLILGWNSFAILLIYLAALLSGTPVFLRSESPLHQELLKKGPLQAARKFFLKIFFKGITAFLYIGKENRDFYEYFKVPVEKLFSTPYAVDNERLFEEAHRFEFRKDEVKKELGLQGKVILFVGKLIPKKNPMDLFRAYDKIRRADTALVFVGEGVLRPVLEAFVREHDLPQVLFAGFQNIGAIGRYYASADIFVLPSGQGETWGLVVNEAMCFGLPVISSDRVGSAADLVQEGRNGYSFPLGNIAALEERLRLLLESPEAREKFGEASRTIIAEYSFENDIDGILRAIKSVTKKV